MKWLTSHLEFSWITDCDNLTRFWTLTRFFRWIVDKKTIGECFEYECHKLIEFVWNLDFLPNSLLIDARSNWCIFTLWNSGFLFIQLQILLWVCCYFFFDAVKVWKFCCWMLLKVCLFHLEIWKNCTDIQWFSAILFGYSAGIGVYVLVFIAKYSGEQFWQSYREIDAEWVY